MALKHSQLDSNKNKEEISKSNSEIKTFLCENRFLEIKWEIVMDDCSNITKNISQIFVIVDLKYIDMCDLSIKDIKIKFSPKEFEVNLIY